MIAMVPPLTCGLITFDETETYTVTLLEVSSPSIRGTVDSTYYTQYSTLSTVEANWSLGSLSCDSTSNTIPGPLNVQHYVPVTVKHIRCWRGRWSRVCRFRRRHQRHHRDCQTSRASQPSLAAQGKTVPWLGPRVADSSSGSRNGAAGAREGMVGATVLGALLVDVARSSGSRSGLHATCEWFGSLILLV
ncbi:hypothetical protein H4582DRAFT_2084919 [Lactarius indigo]|nr:hypothetical protein H4582DRAFT_2084919 [Lactarius indigo]